VAVNSNFLNNTSGGSGGAIEAPVGGVSISGTNVNCNTTIGSGGGIDAAEGNVSVTSSTVLGNSATVNGGGISTEGTDATVTVTMSAISSNKALGNGGGIYEGGLTFTMSQSTVNANTAGGNGGGIYLNTTGTVLSTTGSSIINSTIGANSAQGNGGGIDMEGSGDLTVEFIDLVFNTALDGGGLQLDSGAGAFNIEDSIVYGNTATTGADVNYLTGVFNDLGHNLATTAVTSTNPTGLFNSGTDVFGNPMLGPLAFNGGLTKTYAVPAGSIAIAGTPISGITTDQRGVTRSGTTPTIGAYEFVAPAPKHSKW
jgi:predicted outer membrane repeat protein